MTMQMQNIEVFNLVLIVSEDFRCSISNTKNCFIKDVFIVHRGVR